MFRKAVRRAAITQGWYIGITAASQAVKAGSTPVPCSSSEIPLTAPLPALWAESCAGRGISSLLAPTRSAGLGARDGSTPSQRERQGGPEVSEGPSRPAKYQDSA